MRRLLTFLFVCAVTSVGTLFWLHDGDLVEAVEPVMVQWDAEGLAKNAGIDEK